MNLIYAILVAKLFVLLVMFQLKHFIADYPLQGKYCLGKFKPGWDFIPHLLAHVSIHMIFTCIILLLYCPWLFWWQVVSLVLLDGSLHFVMDRIKASPKYLGRFKPLTAEQYKSNSMDLRSHSDFVKEAAEKNIKNNTYFWWSLGFDQLFHHLSDLLIIFIAIQIMLFQ